MNQDLTNHVASILKISLEDASKWIEEDKVIRKYLKSKEDTVVNAELKANEAISNKKRSIFVLDEEEVRLEKIFHLWFERIGNIKKMNTIEKFLNGETKARKALKGYLQSTGIEDLDIFVSLFNFLIPDKNLSLNGGLK